MYTIYIAATHYYLKNIDHFPQQTSQYWRVAQGHDYQELLGSYMYMYIHDVYNLNSLLPALQEVPILLKAGSDGVYTTKMAKHAGTKVKTEEKYKATATQTHIYKFVWRTKFIKNIRYHGNGV